ncbi:MAG: hypothetical protein KME60_12965 [Cyanomargarita calcarea GSE-NOS-MK-12-04C]|jgi:hypothetical protein|uniref:Uncharacterized protein n=1 Tax=Cyanomargarita calcarea GSE-NOS-MK-12-04C TaxID=2839659 RepID=A0A951QLS8_9CYAN|nr:hypothetical protein [Cyanomargarita calcarea GSE-NOS-MK-12-04C]
MFAQFQSKYPFSSLTSELVEIFQGKYIVRAIVQIEGVIRATGMAASETIEDAEDKARVRALMVLEISLESQKTPVITPEPNLPQPAPAPLNQPVHIETRSVAAKSEAKPQEIPQGLPVNNNSPVTAKNEVKPQEIPQPLQFDSPVTAKNEVKPQEIPQPLPTNNQQLQFDAAPPEKPQQPQFFEPPVEDRSMMFDNLPKENLIPGITPNNITPFIPRSYDSREDVTPLETTTKRKKKSEPEDLSDPIAKIGVEMDRLDWSIEQGREHLKKTYNKRARSLLNDEELIDFLRFLESQPTPLAPADPGF